jgi:hypothetical protein
MKRLAFVCTLVAGASLSAQTNTFPFPESGNVGIGTTSPMPNVNSYNSIPLTVGGGLVDTSAGSTGTSCSVTQVFQQTNWNSPIGTIRVRGNLYHTWHTEMGFGVRNGENSTIEPLILKASGRIGIGTHAPDQKLTIKGGGIGFDHNSADKKLYSPADGDLEWMTHDLAGVHGFAVSHQGEKRVYLNTSGSSYFNGGNVGIGTTNPVHKLAVQGNASFADGNTAVLISNDSYQGGRAFLVLDKNAQNGIASGSDYIYLGQENTQGVLVSAQDTPLKLGSGSAHIMTLAPSGNVGIGTTNPQHKLAVNGTIKAKEVIVETTGWSDYVFADDYRLAPLAEVEAHIKTNKHLPGIPSAAQVAESGVNVGDVQAALLAKVEELTLHLIAQEKNIQTLQKQNDTLQRRVSQLEAR